MQSSTRTLTWDLRSRTVVACAVIVVILAAIFIVAAPVHPAVALTNGQAVTAPFPRVAAWWSGGTLAQQAKLDYTVPYEWQPMSPDLSRLATMKALNPELALFADASAVELNYLQPDSAGNPDGPAGYDAERIGAVPTSWILTQVGSTLNAAITTTVRPTQTISVSDSTKFRVSDLAIIENEKCVVVSVGTGTITVRRGWAGSAAVNHAAGVRVASAVSSWPYSVKLDLTDDCPVGRATGQIATPGTGSERARDWMARRTAAHYRAAGFDGVEIDLCVAYMSWFKSDGTSGFRTIASRTDPTVEIADYNAYDTKWAAGLRAFHTSLRAAIGPDAAILTNEGTPEFDLINGSRIEGFPKKTTTSSEWHRQVIGPNRTYYPSYLEWCNKARNPNFTTLSARGDSFADYQLMRFGLTSALLGDGFFAFTVPTTHDLAWYDEYDNAGSSNGYLGQPVGPAFPVAQAGADLLNGDGSMTDAADLNAWTLYARSNYAATKSLESGTAKIQITQSAGLTKGVLLRRAGISLSSGTEYTLSFRAKATTPLTMQTQVSEVAGDY
jgi:hypothetical protein